VSPRLLLSLTALFAAALTALAFPEMKTLLLAIPVALVLLATGCSSISKSLRNLPDGHFENLEMTETGKVTNTTAKFAILDKDADVIRARGVDLRHSNIWMPNVALKTDVAVIDISTSARKRTNPPPLAAPKLGEGGLAAPKLGEGGLAAPSVTLGTGVAATIRPLNAEPAESAEKK
jgi:hypothetical protein